VAIFSTVSPFHDETADKISIVANTLKLTEQSDFVMDGKGETIYRRRPYRYVLESRTFRRLEQGSLQDDIPERLIATGTPLATLRRVPHKSREFIKANYLPIAFRLRVLGKELLRTSPIYRFEVAVPQRYTLVMPFGIVEGVLDGTPFTGPRFLGSGTHTFEPRTKAERIVLIWGAAIERGYSPFATVKADYSTAQD
jgi:hypothetical protein